MPPVRLSYHRGNHYNSLIDPRSLTIGAGLGFSSLQGVSWSALGHLVFMYLTSHLFCGWWWVGFTHLFPICFIFEQGNVDKDQIKAAIKAQQDQQIDNVTYVDIYSPSKSIHQLALVPYFGDVSFSKSESCCVWMHHIGTFSWGTLLFRSRADWEGNGAYGNRSITNWIWWKIQAAVQPSRVFHL